MKTYQVIIKELGEGKVKLQEPMSLRTTMKVGGPADLFFTAKTSDELIKAVGLAKFYKIPYFVMGGGSNILVNDKGFRGLVIKNATGAIKILGVKGKLGKLGKSGEVYVMADSGVLTNLLVRNTLNEGLSGLENFLGQPGTLGGGLWINAHTMVYKDFLGDHLYQAKVLVAGGEIKTVPASYFQFSYDQSRLQQSQEMVLSAVFKMQSADKEKIWEKANKISLYRQETQPKFPSSGCTFQNISKSTAISLGIPNELTSAGFLLEAVGLKGYRIGGAEFSKHHANFIINLGDATASDILGLINLGKKKVKERYHLDLKTEVVFVEEKSYGQI